MQNKNCKSSNFCSTATDNNASYTLKLLLKARQWCKGLIDSKIANGEKSDTWTDPWIEGQSLVDKFGWKSMIIFDGHSKKASTLISRNKWKDHLDRIPTQLPQTVTNIKIHDQMPHDFWFWTPSNDGHFSLKSTWNQIRSKNLDFNWTKIIWDKYYASKMSTCSLLAKLNKLILEIKLADRNKTSIANVHRVLSILKIETPFISMCLF